MTQKKRGALDLSTSDIKLEESSLIVRLKNGGQYKECEKISAETGYYALIP